MPLPFRSEIAREAAHAGERAHQRAAADPLRAARRHEGAHVGWRQRRECFQRRRAAEMLGEKGEELQHVAPIGFERLRRITALVAEMAEPAFDLGGDLGGDEIQSCSSPWSGGGGPLGGRWKGRRRSARFLADAPSTALARSPFPASRGQDKSARSPFPFLNRPESAQPAHMMPGASSMSWSRSRSTGPIPTGCRRSLSSRPATSSRVPLGAREATAVVWAENPKPNPRLDNRLKDVEEKLDLPPLQARAARLRRLGRELHDRLARHGAAHVPAHGRASRRRARARRRAPCRLRRRSA